MFLWLVSFFYGGQPGLRFKMATILLLVNFPFSELELSDCLPFNSFCLIRKANEPPVCIMIVHEKMNCEPFLWTS